MLATNSMSSMKSSIQTSSHSKRLFTAGGTVPSAVSFMQDNLGVNSYEYIKYRKIKLEACLRQI